MTSTTVSENPDLEASGGPDMGPAAVLLVGFPEAAAREIAAAEGIDAAVFVAGGSAEAQELLSRHEIAVLCLGPELAGAGAETVLNQVLQSHPDHRGCNVVLSAGSDLEIFQDLVSTDQLYYLTQKPPPRADVVHILQSGIEHYHARGTQVAETDDDDFAIATHRVLKLTEGLARAATLDAAMARTVEAVSELVEADRASVLFYDPGTETLWSRRPGQNEERRESAAAGLVSFVVRTKNAVRLEHVGSDPRYDREADNENGSSEERFLAVAVSDPASGGRVWAVLVALRDPESDPFTESDEGRLRLLAEQLAPIYGRFLLQTELEERAAQRHGVWGTQAGEIFREEALEHHVRGMQDQGHVLEIAPGWTTSAYRLLLLVVVVGLVLSVVLPIHEYASGKAVVRIEGQTSVTARVAGSVVSVDVEPGQQVEAGELLVRLYGAPEENQLDQARRDFESGLANRLRRPNDPATASSLNNLRTRWESAKRTLEERSIRAPHTGTVGDVWVETNRYLRQGEPVLTIDGGEKSLSIVALIPGNYGPLIEPGMELRLELDGFSYSYQHLRVESVGEEIVGPAEARRFLGLGIGDAVTVSGSVISVTARLPGPTFEADGQTFAYRDGILGTAEIKVRSQKVLTALIPALKALRNP